MNQTTLTLALAVLLTAGAAHSAEKAEINVHVDKPGHAVAPTLWGIFFEDINCSADGGIYAEMVRNRSFEDSDKPDFWSVLKSSDAKGKITVTLENPMGDDLLTDRNRRSLRVNVTQGSSEHPFSVANGGYWGIAVQSGGEYALSFHARAAQGFSGPLIVELQSSNGVACARGEITGLGADWKQFKTTLAATRTEPAARLVLSFPQPGTVWLDMVSLFPKQTWKDRGLRTDLMDKLSELSPAFVRFPGGCWVEGDTMKYAYRWKDTMGDLAQRRTQHNIWEYNATHGIGFHEYLQTCEDLGSAPLFVINCGMSHKETIPMEQIGPFVQDALDALEYCNGPVTSRYGALRAHNGHPEPFNLRLMEIGNENGGPAYNERWPVFYHAIKAAYPNVQLIANVWGGYPTNILPEVVDEHYYNSPEFFMVHADQYDKYDRKGPKVYIGEYAVTQGCGQGNLRAAVGEAAFMTGVERNSDVVTMASYAPLFANVNYKKWNPDLICYDSARTYVLPSFYVQKLFSQNRGDVVLPVTVESPEFTSSLKGGNIGVGTWATTAEFKDIKVTSGNQTLFQSDLATTNGWKFIDGAWSVDHGVLRQSASNQNVRAILSTRAFTNFTYSLKARKLSGDEGFLILFNVTDDGAKSWWNIGGWNNDHHALELGGVIGKETKGRIETNRWYDIRVDVAADGVKCYLDGKLTSEGTAPKLKSLYSSATRDNSTRDVILKVVNAADDALETDVKLDSAASLGASATAITLASQYPEDENSLDKPEYVIPKTTTVSLDNNSVHHVFPGNSVTIFRIKGQ